MEREKLEKKKWNQPIKVFFGKVSQRIWYNGSKF